MEKLVPKLRFPEFQGNWEEKKLKNVSNYFNGGSFENDVKEEGRYELITLKSVDMSGNLAHSKRYLDIEVPTLKKGTLVMILSEQSPGLLGMTAIISEENKYVLNQRVAEIRPKSDVVSYFLSMAINRNQKYFSKHGAGTKVQNISKPNVENYTFLCPKPEEQQKIATFLTSVDERLTLLAQQKEKLELYKKGVMQQIFSQKLRFKDENENEYPDWEEKKLGEIGFFQTSSIDKLTKDDEKKVFLVNYMNVYRHEDINNETVKSFQIVSAKESQIESCNLKKGDILFTPSSETPDDIGRSVVIFEDLENSVFSYHLMRFRPTIEINILYSHYFCNVPNVLKQLSKYATGSTRFTISVGNFSKVKVQIPHLEEQQKIASFLSAIDVQIEGVSKKIEQTKLFKKGLLQQMFV